MTHPGHAPPPSPGPAASSGPSGGTGPAASDRELARTAGQASAAASAAARELSGRHRRAVFAYAARCTAAPAATELLCTAAQSAAVRSFTSDGGTPAWRPHLLGTVVETAAEWGAGQLRRHLAPELLSWLAESGAEASAPGGNAAEGPLLARSFRHLHERQQIVLWHLFVEQEDIAQVGLYAGVGRAVVQRWSETAEDEFRAVYGRLYEESAPPDCRPFSRLVVTTARTGLARTAGTDGFNEIGGHLGGCEDCSRAFHDLSRLNGKEWAPLLAESLLPWNGKQYRADRTRAREGERQPPVRSAASSPVPSGLRLPVPRRWPGKAAVAVVAAAVVLGVFLGPGGSGPASTTSSTTARNSSGFDAWGRDTRPVGGKGQATPTPRPAPSPVTTGPSGAPSSSPARKAPGKPKNPKPPPGKPSQPGPPRVGLADTRLHWDFRSAGTHPADTSSFGRSGTYHGHVDWREDRGGSVWFDGDSFVRTEQAALDTSHSFTVSAWARLTSDDGFHTVAGQDGDNISGFFLQSTQDDNRWRLAMGHRDSAAVGEDQVLSAAPPAKDAWQHLTGVYDAEKRQIRLYVDGQLQGTAERTSSWRANGPFTVGRGLREGDKADKYKGYIDDVRVFQRAVSAAEATALADAGPNG